MIKREEGGIRGFDEAGGEEMHEDWVKKALCVLLIEVLGS